MKFQLLNASILGVLVAGMPTTRISAHAEAHCPGNIASVTPRVVARALIVIPVKINHSGPFDFMVDTGSQLTVVDPALASQLGLKLQGTVGLVATANYLQASVAVLDTLEVGSHVVERATVAVQDLRQIQAADSRIRGVLGENFLAHFDLLIDYQHKLLCLDEANLMQGEIRGERVPLVMAKHPENDLPFTQRLVISVRLSDTGKRQILLQLDSGSDGPIIYAGNKELETSLLKRATVQGNNVSKAQQAFALLPPQDMQLGTHTLNRIPFVTPVHAEQAVPDREEDGILPTVLFQRVYINNTDHYVVFDPK
jgi:predicted aspartyl protease